MLTILNGLLKEAIANVKGTVFLKALPTTLQSIMNAKLSKQKFWLCYENGLSKTIQTIPHNL